MEQLRQHPDDEVYTIGQVAESAGVLTDTIRSWERRFGIPAPARSPNGQRVHAREDLRLIEAIRAAQARGRTMTQTIAESRGRQDEVTTPGRAVGHVDRDRDPDFGGPLLEAVSRLDFSQAGEIIRRASWAIGAGVVALDLLYPTTTALKAKALEGAIADSVGRAGLAWLTRKLLACLDAMSPERGIGQCVLNAGLHDDAGQPLGLALACTLAEAGYVTTWAGTGHGASGIEALLAVSPPALLVLVAASAPAAIASDSLASRLRQRGGADGWT